jgi:hypothetical protein
MELACGTEFNLMPALSMPGKVLALQTELLKMPQANIVTEHTFMPGIYERKITIPAWTVLTGAEHKSAYRVRLEKGTIAVNTDDGVKVLTGPCEFPASAGMQRAGRVFDDEVVWVDVYDNPDDCANIAVLEDRLYVVPEYGLGDSRTELQKAQIAYRAFLYRLDLKDSEVDEVVSTLFGGKQISEDVCVSVARKMQVKCEGELSCQDGQQQP